MPQLSLFLQDQGVDLPADFQHIPNALLSADDERHPQLTDKRDEQRGQAAAAERSPRARPSVRITPRAAVPDPPPEAARAVQGPRQYRQPDGTLAPTRPPRSAYSVAARCAWQDLVRYARTNGGDRECEDGRSYRHNIGVKFHEHQEYMHKLGLEPETDQYGAFAGFDARKTNPLENPAHPLYGIYYDKERDSFSSIYAQ